MWFDMARKKKKYTITRQRGFADKPDHWIIEANGDFVTDYMGNNMQFDSFDEALYYLEELTGKKVNDLKQVV